MGKMNVTRKRLAMFNKKLTATNEMVFYSNIVIDGLVAKLSLAINLLITIIILLIFVVIRGIK